MKYSKAVVGFGVVTWLVPFLAAIPLMTPEGEPRVSPVLFKVIMVLVGTATGTTLLAGLLSRAGAAALGAGVRIGLLWLAINLALDLAILVPMSGMRLSTYGQTIGLGYLAIPMIAIGMGYAVAGSHQHAPGESDV